MDAPTLGSCTLDHFVERKSAWKIVRGRSVLSYHTFYTSLSSHTAWYTVRYFITRAILSHGVIPCVILPPSALYGVLSYRPCDTVCYLITRVIRRVILPPTALYGVLSHHTCYTMWTACNGSARTAMAPV